jgi:chromosome segregation ATPase
MKNRMGLFVLVLICAGLSIALIWSQRQAVEQKGADDITIGNFSNKWVETSRGLDQQRQVNTTLEGDLNKEKQAYLQLTNSYAQYVEKSDAALKTAREEIGRRDVRIADLESQNQALDEHAIELSNAITNLTAQIEDARRKLVAAEGDKAFLQRELQRLISEKAELERQFNDLSVLRAQVAKIKEEMNVSRRLEWMRKGLYTRSEQKGAEQLAQKVPMTNRPPRGPTYDLNVEVSADGTVKVIPPLPAQRAATNSSPTR